MKKKFKYIRMKEEAPVNSVSAGNIAGITGDPPVSVAAQKKHKTRILRRKKPSTSL